ncbi:hypothetical protein ABFP37_19175 [Burkholderia sp. RS01]|uniref:hypothetical protein n=1 Tax=unclassified Burkholderia TaxID=2613784 RepID=UPI0032185C67
MSGFPVGADDGHRDGVYVAAIGKAGAVREAVVIPKSENHECSTPWSPGTRDRASLIHGRDPEAARQTCLTECGRIYEGTSKGAATSGLTEQIRHSVNNPLTSTDFDFTAVLDDVLGTVGLSIKDAGGDVRFYGGADP